MTTSARPVFFVSDGTGITAETLGNTLLTQFEGQEFDKSTLPFVNSAERAQSTVDYINFVASQTATRPLVFSTTINDEARKVLRGVNGLYLDLFDLMLPKIGSELGVMPSQAQGLAHGLADQRRYTARIEAMNYAMEHDDGASVRDLSRAEVILLAPSRCGKTPTSMYLALQFGVYSTNFPLTEDDLEQQRLPNSLRGLEARCFGLTSDPERLSQIRSERRPGSKYASLAQCVYEIRQAEQLYRRKNIPQLNSANMSIEEIAAVIIQEKKLRKRTQ